MATKLEMNYVPAIDYCESVIDGTHDSPKQVEDGRKLVTSKNIIGGKLDLENCYNISEEDFEQINKRSRVYEWDILMSMIGTVGEICLLKDEPDYAIKNVGVFRAKNESDAKWLYYYLTSPSAQYDIYARLRGSTQKFLPLGELRSFPILKPENEEIKSKIINQLFSIDCLISCKERLNEKVSELISTLFRSWFIDFDPVKAKTEGKLPYGMDEETAALFPDSFVDSELGRIPAGWTIGTIHDIAKQRKDIAKPDVFDDMLPYIGLEHMPRNSIALTEWGVSEGLESNKFRYSKKDILFGKLRPYFHKVGPAPLEGVCSTDILVIQSIDEKLGGFLLPILSSEHFVNFVSGISEGVGLPRTKWEHFKLYKIALPPIEIREKFVSLVDPMLQIIESSIHESKGLEHARDALLPRLMSGELSVS